MRRPSVHKRLERLEAAHKKQLNTPRHFALVRSVSFDGEGHIERVRLPNGEYEFQQLAGPGPEIDPYSDYEFIVLTPAEMDA